MTGPSIGLTKVRSLGGRRGQRACLASSIAAGGRRSGERETAMRKTIIALAGAVAAAATISATALATAGTAAASAHAQTITLKATPASLTCVAIPGQKPTGQEVKGVQFVMAEKLPRYGAPY